MVGAGSMIWWPWLIVAFAAGVTLGVGMVLALFMDWVFEVTGFDEDPDHRF